MQYQKWSSNLSAEEFILISIIQDKDIVAYNLHKERLRDAEKSLYQKRIILIGVKGKLPVLNEKLVATPLPVAVKANPPPKIALLDIAKAIWDVYPISVRTKDNSYTTRIDGKSMVVRLQELFKVYPEHATHPLEIYAQATKLYVGVHTGVSHVPIVTSAKFIYDRDKRESRLVSCIENLPTLALQPDEDLGYGNEMM